MSSLGTDQADVWKSQRAVGYGDTPLGGLGYGFPQQKPAVRKVPGLCVRDIHLLIWRHLLQGRGTAGTLPGATAARSI